MLTVQLLRHLVSDAPDLNLLASFARDVPSIQSARFCAFPLERLFFDDDDDTTPERHESPKPIPATATNAVPSLSAGKTSPVTSLSPSVASVNGRKGVEAPAVGVGAAPSSQPEPSAAPRRTVVGFASQPLGEKSSPTSTASPAPNVKGAGTNPRASSSKATTEESLQFVWGDFGGLANHGSSGGGGAQRRMSRSFGPSSSINSIADEGDISTFGDFSYFIPKTDPSGSSANNKLEQSFNRSMVRRSSVVHHKVLDELEDAPDDEQESGDSVSSFSFSDFSLGADTSMDLSPASKSASTTARDGAFMFGDFMVDMPEGGDAISAPRRSDGTSSLRSTTSSSSPPSNLGAAARPAAATPTTTALTPKPPAAARPATTKSTTSALSMSSPFGMTTNSSSSGSGRTRTVVRQPILFGSLVRDIKVSIILGHSERVRGAAFASTSENCVISTGGDHSAQLRPFRNDGTPLCLYFGHQDMILHIAITPDLNLIATSGSDGILSVFEVSTSKRVGDCRHSVPVMCASFSKNGKYIVSGAQDGVCRLWSSKKKNQSTPMSTYFGHKSLITCISFQPNGEFVGTGSGDTQVHVWSASTGKSHQLFPKLHTHTIMSVQFSHDGSHLLTCDFAKLALSDVASGILLASLDVASLPRGGNGIKAGSSAAASNPAKLVFTAAAFAPQGQFPNYFFVATTDKCVALYEFVVKSSSGPGGGASPIRPPQPTHKKGSEKGSSFTLPDITVTISPEIWSWMSQHRVAWLSTGPRASMLVGDLGGNLSAIRLVPRQGDPVPQHKVALKVKK